MKATATSWPAPTPLLCSAKMIQTISASNQMFTGMPTENQEIFRAARSREYVYVGYSGKANK
jgi:hypothetical protein